MYSDMYRSTRVATRIEIDLTVIAGNRYPARCARYPPVIEIRWHRKKDPSDYVSYAPDKALLNFLYLFSRIQ